MGKKKSLIVKYSQKYGIPEAVVKSIVESGLKNGMSFQQIELGIRLTLGHGKEIFTVQDVATATGMTLDEAREYVNDFYNELLTQGEKPENHGIFKTYLN
jgi:ribosomal protein L7/L12